MVKSELNRIVLATGVLLFSGLMFFPSCKKLELTPGEEVIPPPRVASPNAAYSFRADWADGDSVVFNDLLDTNITNGAYTELPASGPCSGAEIPKIESGYFGDLTGTELRNYVEIFIYGCTNAQFEFDSLLRTRGYPYGSINQQVEGVEIHYVDNNGVLWKTTNAAGNLEPGMQDASTFILTDVFSSEDVYSDFNVRGQFSCAMFDPDGNRRMMENGVFYTRMRSRIER